MKYDLKGTIMQILTIELEEEETVTSEPGRMVYMSDNVKMEPEAKGGILDSFKRKLASESFFLVDYASQRGSGVVAFASEVPGKILPIELGKNEALMAQKGTWLCSADVIPDADSVDKISSGFLGGEGFILVKLEGPGLVFIDIPGELQKVELSENEKIKIDTGCLRAFRANMEYSVSRLEGIKNMTFSGEDLFLATIEGPGPVWIQSMPFDKFAGKISRYIEKSQ